MQTLSEFNALLVQDAKLSIETFFETNPIDSNPPPYALMTDYIHQSSSYRLIFPESSEHMSRQNQFYAASRMVSCFNIGTIGLVAYLSLTVPSQAEIEERFWGRTCRAAIVASCPSGATNITQPYTRTSATAYVTEVVLFDHFDQEGLVFSHIEDQSIWEDFINSTSLFRDFLIISSSETKNNPYRWVEFYSTLKEYGFTLDFSSEQQELNFMSMQTPIVAI